MVPFRGGVFYSGNSNGGGGGGATDVRYILDDKINDDNLLWNSEEGLKSRIMVAGGGGGADSHASAPSWSGNGGAGGGLNGYNNPRAGSCYSYGEGATQTAAGRSVSCGSQYSTYYYSSFGVGGTIHAGGGGGYYGGGAGHHTSAGGGSSFISGHQGCNAIAESSTLESITHTGQPNHYSGLVFTNTKIIDGQGYIWTTSKGSNVKQPQPNGTTSSGHTGNGYARITFVE